MKSHLLKVLFPVIFSIICLFGFAQTFEKYYRTIDDELVYDAQLFDSALCVFALNTGNFNSDIYATKIFKINTQTGKFTDSTLIEPTLQNSYFRGIFDLLKANDSLFIGIGKFGIYGSGEEIQYIVHFNNNLQILFDTIIDIPEIEERFQKTILTEDSKLVSVGTIINSYDNERLLCEKSFFGDSIRYETYSHPGSLTATCVVDIPHKNTYHMFIYAGIERAYNIINKTSLTIDTTLEYPIFFGTIDAVPDDMDSSIYYVAGKQYSYNSDRFDLSFLKINDNGEILNHLIYETDSNTFYTYKCFSPHNQNIYFAGVYPFTQSPPTLYPEPRWILLYKLTKEGEIIWQKFYKGEVNYMAYKVLATKDGGALIFSTKYDWNDPIPNQRDVHILKIDSTGYYTPLTGTDEEFEHKEKQILVYPNPVENKVNFVFGLYKNLEINIFELTGRKVFSKEFKHSAFIDISYLKPGIYPYTISDKNGFFEEGKLVKK